MNRIERIAQAIGRIRGSFVGGMKSAVDMSFNDPRAWSSYGSANALSSGAGKKPSTPSDIIDHYFSSWVYICTMLNAKSCSSVPLRLYGATAEKGSKLRWAGTNIHVPTRAISRARRRNLDSRAHLQPFMRRAIDVEEIVDHPLLDLIRNVNVVSNMSDLIELSIIFLDTSGSAYWYLVRNGVGAPQSIWILPSQYVTPKAGKSLEQYIECYNYTRGTISVDIPAEDVIAFTFPNPKSQITGFAPALGVADAVYNNSQMNIYEASLFENKARVDGLFEVDHTVPMAAVERAKETFAAEFAGTQAAGKRPLLPPGMKFTQTSMTAEEISYIEGRKITREEIAAGLDVPISLLDPNSIRSNVEGAQYFHAKYGIHPRLTKLEEKMNERLLPFFGSGNALFVAFDDPVPEDKAFALEARTRQVGVPILSIDEARSEIGKDGLDIAGVSDVPLVPAGYKPLSEKTGEPEPAPMGSPFGQPGVEAEDQEEPEDQEPPDEEDMDEEAKIIAARAVRILQERLK